MSIYGSFESYGTYLKRLGQSRPRLLSRTSCFLTFMPTVWQFQRHFALLVRTCLALLQFSVII